jgi:hypothetical protein
MPLEPPMISVRVFADDVVMMWSRVNRGKHQGGHGLLA